MAGKRFQGWFAYLGSADRDTRGERDRAGAAVRGAQTKTDAARYWPAGCLRAPYTRGVKVKTILVLEDEPPLLKLLRHMLKQYKVLEAATAEQALGLFSDHHRPINLLVADVTLPTSSGIVVALLLRFEVPDMPVILTSGYPEANWSPRDSADLERLGSKSVAILQKPFPAQELLTTVRRLIGEPQSAIARTA